MQKFMKKSLPAALAAGSLLGLGVASHEAAADSILFPYLSTQSGVLSFVTIVNDGSGGTLTGQYTTVSLYQFTYGYKAAPVNQRAGCTHFDAPVATTPADMMTFEVGARVGGGQPLFEAAGDTFGVGPGKLTSTSAPLSAAGSIAFLIVDAATPVASGIAADTTAGNTDIAHLFGWAEVIDPAANMTLAYSTHNFFNDNSGGAGNAIADLTNLSGSIAALSWYSTSAVTTSWHVLHLASKDAMIPSTGGGIRGAVEAMGSGTGGTIFGGVAAFDRDENPFSGSRRKPVRCFAIITRADIMAATSVTATNDGGWTYLGNATGTVDVISESFDVITMYITSVRNTLVHKIQAAIPAATGLGARSAINREPTAGSFLYVP